MVTLESLADAAWRRDHLELRGLTQDFLRDHPRLDALPRPTTTNSELLTIAAALVELFALRAGQGAPDWTSEVGALATPMYLIEAASRMKNLRTLCERESPEPLRKRGLYAPPAFLTFA